MSEEEKGGLESPDETPAGAGGKPVNADPGTAEGEEGEGVVTPEEEEKDERGVPLKNRLAELERKNRQLETRLAEEHRRNLQLQPTDKGEGERPGFKELTISEIAERAGTTPETVKAFIDAFENRIDRRLHLAEVENKKNIEYRREKEAKMMESLEEFDRDYGDDADGHIFIEDSKTGQKAWNKDSKLLQKAREILQAKPKYQKLENGPLIALMEAKAELLKAKPENKGSSALDATQSMLGRGGRTNRPAPVGGAGWRPTRELSDVEYDKLTREQKTIYGKWDVEQRLKTLGLTE